MAEDGSMYLNFLFFSAENNDAASVLLQLPALSLC